MKKFALIMAAFFLMAGTAMAAPLDTVNVKLNDVLYRANVGLPYWTGVYEIQVQGGMFEGTYGGFCVDRHPALWSYSLYDIEAITPAMGKSLTAAAWLLNQYYMAGNNAAYTQAAIWELMFETSGSFDITTGDWKTSMSASDERSMAINALINAALDAGSGFNFEGLYLAHSPSALSLSENDSQDYIFRKSVPEPGTILLFGFGLVGLAGVRRFKK